MSNEWDDYAEAWDDDPDVTTYADKAYSALSNYVDVTDQRVFDFGCGTGLLSERLAKTAAHVVALDGSPKMIGQLIHKKLEKISPVVGFLSEGVLVAHDQFAQKFDLITASSVCAFLSDYEQTLGLLKSVLLPGATYVQWDWLAQSENSRIGMRAEAVFQVSRLRALATFLCRNRFKWRVPGEQCRS